MFRAGRENGFWQISQDSRGKDFFPLEINILRATSRYLFVIVTSTMAENNILRFPEEGGVRRNLLRSSPPYATVYNPKDFRSILLGGEHSSKSSL